MSVPHARRIVLSLCVCLLGVWAQAQQLTTPTLTARRIISLPPQATETIFALGAADRLVAVGASSRWPAEAQRLPNVGDSLNLQVEKIISLKPDLVIVSRPQLEYIRDLNSRGIRTLTISSDTIQQALWMMHDLSFVVEKRDAGRTLVTDLVERLNAQTAQYKNLPRRRVLMVIYHPLDSLKEMLAIAPGNYLDEVLRIAGGSNAVTKWNPDQGLAVRLTPAELKQVAPEVVIDILPEDLSAAPKQALEAQWRQAVGEQAKIILVHDPYLGVPGVRMPQTINMLAKWIHGDAPVSSPATQKAK